MKQNLMQQLKHIFIPLDRQEDGFVHHITQVSEEHMQELDLPMMQNLMNL